MKLLRAVLNSRPDVAPFEDNGPTVFAIPLLQTATGGVCPIERRVPVHILKGHHRCSGEIARRTLPVPLIRKFRPPALHIRSEPHHGDFGQAAVLSIIPFYESRRIVDDLGDEPEPLLGTVLAQLARLLVRANGSGRIGKSGRAC